MKGSLEDYDGDGNTTEGMYAEVEGVKAKLYTAIQQYAREVSLVNIGYDPTGIHTGLLMPMATALSTPLLKQRTTMPIPPVC